MLTSQSAVAADLMGGNVSAGSRFENSGGQIASQRPDLLCRVSNAQQRVLEFLLAGLTEPQIAEKIGRSRHTVHDHTKAIYSALNVNNRVQLVLMFSQPTATSQAVVANASQTQMVPLQTLPVQAPAAPQARPLATPILSSAPTGPISDVVFTPARTIGPAKNLAVA